MIAFASDALAGVAGAWRYLAAAGFGLLAGQLATVAARFLPDARLGPWPVHPCVTCGGRGRATDVFATLGWLVRGHRCSRCRTPLSAVPPLMEVANALLWTALLYRWGLSPRTAVLMAFVTALLVLIVVDFEHFLLPDAITLPGIVAGVVACTLPGWPVSLLDSALTAGVGYFVMMALAKVAESYYGEEALGQGDWKMVAMLGAFLGSTKALTTVLIANGAGAIFGLLLVATLGERGRQKLPLGTFLGAAGIAMVFW